MSLAVSGYVKQFYKGNTFGATQAGRKGYNVRSLISADMQAVKRALKDLHDYDYSSKEDEEDENELFKKVQAYVNTYNNYMGSVCELDHDDVDRVLSKWKKMTKSRQADLAAIGIKALSDGSLKVDTDALEKASKNKIRKVFSGDSDYGTQIEKYMKKIQTLVRRNNLGITSQTPVQTDEDAALAGKLAEALEGRQINESI